MRKIEIQLKDPTPTSGDIVEGQVLVTCDDDFQCERLHVSIKGRELARVVIHAGKVTIVHEEKHDHIDHRIDLGENLTIPMGESRYDFSFPLPSNIPGSYEGAYGSIKYTIEAKAEVSWARDPQSKQDITLAFNSEIDAESIPGPKS
ncbi:MAG: sporulation protein, partial [Candidatus Thorarchaeota archaeon]